MKIFSKFGFVSVVLFICCTNVSLWSMKHELENSLRKLQFCSVDSALAKLDGCELSGVVREREDEDALDALDRQDAEGNRQEAERKMHYVKLALKKEAMTFSASILYLMGYSYDTSYTTEKLGTIFENLPTDNWRQLSKLRKQLSQLNKELNVLCSEGSVDIADLLCFSTGKSIVRCFDCLNWLLWTNYDESLPEPSVLLCEYFSLLRHNSFLRYDSSLNTCLDTLFNYVALLKNQLSWVSKSKLEEMLEDECIRTFGEPNSASLGSDNTAMSDISASDGEEVSDTEGYNFDAFAQKDGNGKEYLKRVCKHQKLTRRRRSDYMAK